MKSSFPFWRSRSAYAVLLYFALFVGSTVIVLTLFYVQAFGQLRSEIDNFILREAEVLHFIYNEQGEAGLIRQIAYRGGQPRGHIYWLARNDGVKLGGNLDRLPNLRMSENLSDGWVHFTLKDSEGIAIRIRGQMLAMGTELSLFIGRDMSAYEQIQSRTSHALFYALGLMIVLGPVGGVVMVYALLARLARINRTSAAIMAGDLSERVAVLGNGDEFDLLAEHLNAMLDRIAALIAAHAQIADNIAHELRSPINRLRGQLEFIQTQIGDAQKTNLHAAISEVDHILKIFNALLELTQIEAGSLHTHARICDLTALVGEVADLFAPAIEEADIAFDIELPDAPVMCRGDRALLIQAVSNLVENAFKYGRSDAQGATRISLSLTQDDMQAHICIADTGCGVI